MSEYRALSSIQYQSDIGNDDLIDVRFPALSNRRESTNVVSGQVSRNNVSKTMMSG